MLRKKHVRLSVIASSGNRCYNISIDGIFKDGSHFAFCTPNMLILPWHLSTIDYTNAETVTFYLLGPYWGKQSRGHENVVLTPIFSLDSISLFCFQLFWLRPLLLSLTCWCQIPCEFLAQPQAREIATFYQASGESKKTQSHVQSDDMSQLLKQMCLGFSHPFPAELLAVGLKVM